MIAVDLRGHGMSTGPDAMRMRFMASFLAVLALAAMAGQWSSAGRG